MKTKTKVLIQFFSLASLLVPPQIALSGFEIGNGKKTIKNTPGNYELIVPEKLEVGFSNKFTELISPLFEGTPRTRLQINIVKDEKISKFSELVNSVSPLENWNQIKLAGFEGIKSEVLLPTKLLQIEYRLLHKEGEIIIIHIEGVPTNSPTSTFNNLTKALDSLKIKTTQKFIDK